jgi:hypothetical protein
MPKLRVSKWIIHVETLNSTQQVTQKAGASRLDFKLENKIMAASIGKPAVS